MKMEYQGYKVTFRGESPRYMKVGKRGFIKPADVPADVMAYFNSQGTPKKEVDSVPTEPEPKPELEASELEATDKEIEEAYKQMQEYQEQSAKEAVAELHPEPQPAPPVQPFTEMELDLMEEVETLRAQAERREMFTAESLAKTFYEEFGVYTIWAGVEPRVGDTHPVTGKAMTRYDMGLAYRARRAAVDVNLRERHTGVKAAREAPARHEEEMSKREADPSHNAPAYRTFNERTSVEGQKYSQSSTHLRTRDNDPISDEATAEPNLHGQTIRPYW